MLAVAPSTGSVHVRDGATLTDEEVLTVSVTDLNGREDGLTTSIELMVRLRKRIKQIKELYLLT